MITERTLKNWRRDALADAITPPELKVDAEHPLRDAINYQLRKNMALSQRILRLTGELLDQHLLRKA